MKRPQLPLLPTRTLCSCYQFSFAHAVFVSGTVHSLPDPLLKALANATLVSTCNSTLGSAPNSCACIRLTIFRSVTKEQNLAFYRALSKNNIDWIGCLSGSTAPHCGTIQYYILMIATAVAIPILCGLFTVLFYCCRCCPCCKYKCCCYNCGGKQPRNKLTPEGQWVSGPYTKCERYFWYSAHAFVLAILLLLSIGGGFSVSQIPDNIAVIFDAIIYVVEIPGKFFEQTASPAILVATKNMNTEVGGINTNYSTAALAVKAAATALAASAACQAASSCCNNYIQLYGEIRDLGALTKEFDRDAFSGFLNNTLNGKLSEGKDKVKDMNIPTATIRDFKEFPKMVPAGTGFVLFVPVFLPILINLFAFLCKKQCPFWCSHICGFLFSGLVFLIFIIIFIVGSALSETCLFLPAATIDKVDTSGLEAVFPGADANASSAVTDLFKHCLAKKSGGNMFLAVKYNISGEIDTIVGDKINKQVLGLDADAMSKITPIVVHCTSGDPKALQDDLRTKQAALKVIVDNIDVSTRASVTKVLMNFADQISSCDVLASGYIGLRESICGPFSDSIFATYFSLYGCGIFLIFFLMTTTKIVKKVSRSSAVAPEQAPKVAGAPPEAASAMNAKTPQVTAKTDQKVTAKADQKVVKKPN
jgi:hypothetical protein